MADIATSVLARLKKKAEQAGRSNQLCLQLFCQEEFLRRLQHSRYDDNLILKGGLFVYALTNFDSRVTVDVDFLLQGIPNTPDRLKLVLDEIIAADTGNSFITFEITRIEPISVTKKYAGVRAAFATRIKNTKTTFSIDFGVGDIIVPGREKRKIPTQLEGFDNPVVSAYSIESTVAEKFDAIMSLMEFSSRMKDYYDILYISRRFDIDGSTLREALLRTFTNRSRDFKMEQFNQLILLCDDSSMKKKWSAFLKKIASFDVSFTEAMKSLDTFLREVTASVIEVQPFSKSWSATTGRWM